MGSKRERDSGNIVSPIIIADIFSRSHPGSLISMSGGGGTGHAPTRAGDPGPTSRRRRRRTWTGRWRRRRIPEARAGAIMNQNPAETGPGSSWGDRDQISRVVILFCLS